MDILETGETKISNWEIKPEKFFSDSDHSLIVTHYVTFPIQKERGKNEIYMGLKHQAKSDVYGTLFSITAERRYIISPNGENYSADFLYRIMEEVAVDYAKIFDIRKIGTGLSHEELHLPPFDHLLEQLEYNAHSMDTLNF